MSLRAQSNTDNSIVNVLTFLDFINYGIVNGGNMVRGYPWSFQYKGRPVSHENDKRYLIMKMPGSVDTLNFTPNDVIVEYHDGDYDVISLDQFLTQYTTLV